MYKKIIKLLYSSKTIFKNEIANFGITIKEYKIFFIKFKKTIYYTNNSTNKIFKLDSNKNHIPFTNYEEIKKYGSIKINRENNTIILPDTKNLDCFIEINGNFNKIEIKGVKRPSKIYCVFEKNNDNRELSIGNCELIGNVNFRIIDSNRKIIIGDNCLFSYGIYIWATDSHSIFDINTNQKINNDKDVYIGNHVWIGRKATINKGSYIPDDCVVGENSFVNKKFNENNSIIAGTPAKTVKHGITCKY